jgi:hypothetical protein
MSGAEAKPHFFAVPDPDAAGIVTYWRTDRSGGLRPWPARLGYDAYGPVFARAPGRPADQDLAARQRWYREVRRPWWDKLEAAIAEDRVGAAARFAAATGRCCCCGQRPGDASATAAGLCPGCRAVLSDWYAQRLAGAAARVRAEVTPDARGPGRADDDPPPTQLPLFADGAGTGTAADRARNRRGADVPQRTSW